MTFNRGKLILYAKKNLFCYCFLFAHFLLLKPQNQNTTIERNAKNNTQHCHTPRTAGS
jgi:hypothetical protein